MIVEPVAGNMGTVAARARVSRKACAQSATARALLIFDEVMTGFRLAQAARRRSTESSPT